MLGGERWSGTVAYFPAAGPRAPTEIEKLSVNASRDNADGDVSRGGRGRVDDPTRCFFAGRTTGMYDGGKTHKSASQTRRGLGASGPFY